MKARRAVVVVSAAQHSRVHRCWHLLIQTLHCGWRVLHCGRRVLHCGRRRSIEIGMLVHKDLHCWSVLRIFTNQGKVSSNIFVNIKIFLRNLRKYLIIYPLDKNPWFGPLCLGEPGLLTAAKILADVSVSEQLSEEQSWHLIVCCKISWLGLPGLNNLFYVSRPR